MVDVLTWQGIRALATCEAVEGTVPFAVRNGCVQPGQVKVRYVQPEAKRVKDAARLVNGRFVPYLPTVKMQPGSIVYSRDTWREPYRAHLAQGWTPRVLVSAFHDAHIQQEAADVLLSETSPITQWFGVQVACQHPRLRAMPLGVDQRRLPAMARAERRQSRDVLLYVNFQRRNEEREACWRRFHRWPDALATNYEPGDDGDLAYFNALGRSRFVLSPPGRGWDCYRTYEAIVMGAIPIVRRQRPNSGVCEQLPVLMVDDWDEVTPELLGRVSVKGSIERLRLSYWAAQIRMASRAAKEQDYGVSRTSGVGADTGVRQHCERECNQFA